MVTSWDRRLLVELHQLVDVLGLHLEVDVHGLHLDHQQVPSAQDREAGLAMPSQEFDRNCKNTSKGDLQVQDKNSKPEVPYFEVKQEKTTKVATDDINERRLLVSSLNDGNFVMKMEKERIRLKEILAECSLGLEEHSLVSKEPPASAADNVAESKEPELTSEEPVLAAWKLRRLTIGVKRIKLDHLVPTSGELHKLDHPVPNSPIVFDGSEEGTLSPSKSSTGSQVDKNGGEEKTEKKDAVTLIKRGEDEKSPQKMTMEEQAKQDQTLPKKMQMVPVLRLSQQRERQKFITKSIINGIRWSSTKLLHPMLYSNVGRPFCTPAPPKFTKKLAVDSFSNFGS